MNTAAVNCKVKLPMPALLHALGMGEFAKASCPSPFRKDKSPSWGVFQRSGQWFFKDQATGESGDELDFIGAHFGIALFPDRLAKYCDLAGVSSDRGKNATVSQTRNTSTNNCISESPLPDRAGFTRGTREQEARLSKLRGIGLAGIWLASERGLLVFGDWHGQECWGLTDGSGRVLELRRLDGKMFPAVGKLTERKSHAVRHSQKSWPVGIQEARNFPKIALVEGMPDFLEAHYCTLFESKLDVAVVAILSASPSICDEALPLFAGKIVRIFPHAEKAGVNGAARWRNQLLSVGARVDLFDFTGIRKHGGGFVKDLLDYSDIDRDELSSGRAPLFILP